MPKKKRPEEKPQDQFKRFLKVANERGVDDNGERADTAFKKLNVKPKKAGQRS